MGKSLEKWINQVHCMDCLEGMKQLPDGCVDLVVTDPPYGIELDYGITYEDTFENWKKLIDKFLPEAIRLCHNLILIPTSKIEGEKYLYSFNPLWRLCWYKGRQSSRSPIGFKDWETIFVFGQNNGHQFHDYLACIPEHDSSIKHPCPKPIKWARWLIDKCSNPGDLILDPFMGSGTTAVAAKQLGRRFIGFEINPDYVKICNQRLKQEVLL